MSIKEQEPWRDVLKRHIEKPELTEAEKEFIKVHEALHELHWYFAEGKKLH